MSTIQSKTLALVTGASQGLGKAFAIELAKRKIDLILVALPNEQLEHVANQAENYGVSVYCYETDLTQKENILELAKWVNQNHSVNILINNAGCGGTERFSECDADYINRIIQLNVTATALLTHQLLPNLMKQEQSYVLNVSSMASFSPIGYKTVYPASKRFVQHFTRGLFQELKNTNVFVSVVHPGPMKTNKDVTKRINEQGIFGKVGLLSPEKVAELSIRQLFKRDSLILLGLFNKINWLLMVIIPVWIRLPLLTKAVSRELKPIHS
jgi:short-subunit dehydrogenase